MSVHEPVRISYNDLLLHPGNLNADIVRAFGSETGCLGFILIDDLPEGYAALRSELFHLAERFATLPEDVRERFARPETSYLFGWSHGKEVMNGRPDLQKGSYYANPLLDTPDVGDGLKRDHPEYYAGNVWPSDINGLEEFEGAFKRLGKVVYDVGVALAKACEGFVEPMPGGQTVESLISSSKCNKARLLHYYPESSTSLEAEDALCGTHVDHSLLTGLCSAMYLDHRNPTFPPKIVDSPTPSAGLHIYPRQQSQAIKVNIPPNCLAFQTGEALELLTGGKLAATPHYVAGSGGTPSNISRETFALFLQPDVDDVIGRDGETFGAFTKRVLGRHYAAAEAEA